MLRCQQCVGGIVQISDLVQESEEEGLMLVGYWLLDTLLDVMLCEWCSGCR